MTQPNDVAAEKLVLGALMLGAEPVELASTDFYRPAHSLIFEAIGRLRAAGNPADPVAVGDELRRAGQLPKTGGGPYLHGCIEAVPARVNAPHYARIVLEHAERRKLIELGSRISQAAADPGTQLSVARELAGRPDTPDAADRGGRKLVLTPASEIEPEPVVWAWEDDGAGRIPAGSLGLFAGREGTGKSSFLIWLSAQITKGTLPGSFKGGPRGVIYVAVEDSWKYTIVPRLMAAGADLRSSTGPRSRPSRARPSPSACPPITGSSRRRSPGTTLRWSRWTRSCRRSATPSIPTSTGRSARRSTRSPGSPTGPAPSSPASPTSTSPPAPTPRR